MTGKRCTANIINTTHKEDAQLARSTTQSPQMQLNKRHKSQGRSTTVTINTYKEEAQLTREKHNIRRKQNSQGRSTTVIVNMTHKEDAQQSL